MRIPSCFRGGNGGAKTALSHGCRWHYRGVFLKQKEKELTSSPSSIWKAWRKGTCGGVRLHCGLPTLSAAASRLIRRRPSPEGSIFIKKQALGRFGGSPTYRHPTYKERCH